MHMLLFIPLFLLAVSCEKVYDPSYPPPLASSSIEMETIFSNDLDRWDFDLGDSTVRVETSFSEDWDDWDYSYGNEDGEIETTFSEDWDRWELDGENYNLTIRTAYSEDYNRWEIRDPSNGWKVTVRTTFTEDSYDESWNRWEVSGDNLSMDINTVFSDIDDWRVNGNFHAHYPLEYRIAILFVPVITNVMIANDLLD